MNKIILKILIVLVVLITVLIVFIFMTWDKTYDAPYPNITASQDSTMIARGKYLAFGPAHCSTCHVPIDKIMEVENGLEIPLSGGWELNIPPGTFRAPNLTPDMETGIGKYSDGELARTLRHSVNPDHHAIFPFMPFQEISDEDLIAIISFLRSQKAVSHDVKKSELSFIGKAIYAFGLIKPVGPKNTPPISVAKDATIEYGSYIADKVANCRGCHTKRDLKTGAFIGTDYAGGMIFPQDDFTMGKIFVTPNITPDKETGVMTKWSEEMFVNRFQAGRIHEGTPMPWGAFSRIDEVELKALYRFLQSLDPVKNRVDKTVYAPGEELPD